MDLLPLDDSGPGADLLRRADRLAVRGHAGQLRDDGAPYITHPRAVARLLREELGVTDPAVLAAALLHDLLEDTEVTGEVVEREAGREVAGWVRGLTKGADGEGSRAARIRRDLDRIRRAGPQAVLVKIADRLHNLRTIKDCEDGAKRRRFLEETAGLYLPFFEAERPDLAGRVREALRRAREEEASR